MASHMMAGFGDGHLEVDVCWFLVHFSPKLPGLKQPLQSNTDSDSAYGESG